LNIFSLIWPDHEKANSLQLSSINFLPLIFGSPAQQARFFLFLDHERVLSFQVPLRPIATSLSLKVEAFIRHLEVVLELFRRNA